MFHKIRFIILLFGFQLVCGQHSQDSLKKVLKSESSNILKLGAALGLSNYYTRINLDSSLHYIIIAEGIAPSLKDKNQIPRVRLQKAGVLLSMQDLLEAENLLNQNLKEAELKPQILAKTYQNLGSIHMYRKEFEKATNRYLDALKLFEAENDSIGIAKTSANIGIIHSRLKKFGEAISFFENAQKYTVNDEMVNLQILMNLAGTYHEQKAFVKSIATGNEALALAQKINSPIHLGTVYSNLCNSYLGAKQYDAAIASGLKGIEARQRLGQNTAVLFNNLGYAYLQKGAYQQAIAYLKKIPSGAPANLKSLVYNNLAETYGKLNDNATAWRYAQMHKKINDSLNAIMFQERDSITGVIRAYETEKSEQAIDLLNTKNELNESKIKAQRDTIWTIGLLAVLLLGLGIVIYKNQKTQQQYKAAILKNRLLRTQLNPHFLFNALNSMQGFNYGDEKKKLSDYINSFSKLMRSILESSDQDFITIEDDANAIREYINIQKLSSNEKFIANISIHEDCDSQTLIPPMFTQPFVENAVLHGMKNLKNGVIDISYHKKGDRLIFEIKDNGLGYSTEATNTPAKLHRSMSINIIEERIVNLRKTRGYSCNMQTTSNETGTTVLLTFPAHQKELKVSLKHG